MKRKRLGDDPEPPRPPCACGAPAAFQVSVEVRPLALDRASGAYSRLYWTASYHAAGGTKIETTMCEACVASNVSVTVTAAAKVEKKAQGIP